MSVLLHNSSSCHILYMRFSSVLDGWVGSKIPSPASVNKIIEGRLISACQMSQVQRENRRGELNLSCIYADPACQFLVCPFYSSRFKVPIDTLKERRYGKSDLTTGFPNLKLVKNDVSLPNKYFFEKVRLWYFFLFSK